MVMSPDLVVVSALVAGAGTAAAVDVASRRIPNAVSFGTAAAGVALAAAGLTGVTLASSILGFTFGLLLMLPGHIFGATGAGDVKLFAGAGAVLGAGRVVDAFLLVALAGGALSLFVAWQRGRLGSTVAAVARLCGRSTGARAAIESPAAHNRFAYGPAIAAGCILAALR